MPQAGIWRKIMGQTQEFEDCKKKKSGVSGRKDKEPGHIYERRAGE
jgi:hypothetical protein